MGYSLVWHKINVKIDDGSICALCVTPGAQGESVAA